MTRSDAEPRLSGAYWRLWWATGVGTAGDGAFAAAVPLLAVTLTRDPRLVAMVSAATYLPWLLLSLPAGALVDRYDHATLMWRSQAVQAVLVGCVAVLAAFGHVGVPLLAVLAFGLGACAVVSGNAAHAILPDLVARPRLHGANGHQQAVATIGQQFLGPPAGSMLFGLAVALPFGMSAATSAVSAALLATLPRHRHTPGSLRVGRPPMRAAIADGLRSLVRHRLLRTLAVLLGVNTFCGQLGNATLVLLATGALHLDARGYGLLLAGAAVGSLLGALVNARVVRRFGAQAALLAALAANAVVFAGIGLSPNAIMLGLLLAAGGFVTTLWNIVTVTLRQQIVPSPLLGRVNSVYKTVGWGLMPLGALAGGLVAHAFGLRAPYLVAGVLRGVALLVVTPVLIRAMREREPWPGERIDGEAACIGGEAASTAGEEMVKKSRRKAMSPPREGSPSPRPDSDRTHQEDPVTTPAPTVPATARTFEVPGARLHYEVRGHGPAVVLVGAPMGADAFAPLADLLAADHTVLTTDPRGINRSPLQDPEQDSTPQLRADDLSRLLAHLDLGPAVVLGSSGGAVTALALAQADPDRVHTVIAHEPPLVELLEDRDKLRAGTEDQIATYLAGDVIGAWTKFMAQANIVMPEGAIEAMFGGERDPRQVADERRWFAHELLATTRWQPDLDALRAVGTRIVVGIGEDSAEQLCDRASRALAGELGVEPTLFPGGHIGFVDDPGRFATRLRAVLLGG
ncbi:MFS transporter [Nonomuraea mangrovi]|uniref:MFS transporter n=1 Tax=Nonomuraea mangrovi TaxID=2316207 RepID=A0ABW4TCL1_9ACTN